MNINRFEELKIFIRADASVQIGSGHIMRCLTLAEALKKSGAIVEFITAKHKGNLINFIQEKGFQVNILPHTYGLRSADCGLPQSPGASQTEDAESVISVLNKKNKKPDWLITDNYAIDYKWHQKLRPYTKKIMAIDDLANRKHDCDLLLDQNFYIKKNRYKNFVPKHCIQLLGPEFALLRKEFADARKNLRKRTGDIKQVLIFFGGSDATNQTKKAIDAIKLLNKPDIIVDVILGALNPHKEEIYSLVKGLPNISCYTSVNNMAEFMAKADLAIGAGGSATWERCCLGLPAIVLIISNDQKKLSEDMFNQNYLYFQSEAEKISCPMLTDLIDSILSDSEKNKTLISKNINLVDGTGAIKVAAIINYLASNYKNFYIRKAKEKDLLTYFKWRNDPDVIKNSLSSSAILKQKHTAWFYKHLNSENSKLYLLEFAKEPIGQIRFDIKGTSANITYSVDTNFRGVGLGVYLLKEGINYLKQEINKSWTFCGIVKKNNIPSKRVFSKAGFTIKKNMEKGEIVYQLQA